MYMIIIKYQKPKWILHSAGYNWLQEIYNTLHWTNVLEYTTPTVKFQITNLKEN